jgi:predicted adenylyl cyclase CyaB
MPPVPPHCNLERKTRYPDLGRAAEALARLGARCAGVEEQSDTYFQVPAGRLKLRVGTQPHATLIWYDRPNTESVRASRYHLVSVANPDEMGAALEAALGLRGIVRKRRQIWHWHNVRIHLDLVEGLGSFVELEAVLSPAADAALSQRRLEQLSAALELDSSADEAGSYSDLLGL